MEKDCKCNEIRHKLRSKEAKRKLSNRLKRIEGQVRGVNKMVENDAYCTDILIQISAITSALNSFGKEILENHIKTCVVDDIKAGKTEVIDDLLKTIQKLMK